MPSRRRTAAATGLVGALAWGCVPRGDLDAAAEGGGDGSAALGGTMNGGGTGATDPSGGMSARAGNDASGGKAGSGGSAATSGGASSGGLAGAGQGGDTNTAAQAGVAGGGSSPLGPLPALPDELNDPPVTGKVKWSAEASWETAAGFEPAFEVDTPGATYFLVKRLGTIVSMVDAFASGGREWIGYSHSFRPKRGLPNLSDCCQSDAKMELVTTLDEDSITAGHVRLNSKSVSEEWSLVWDFYRTHVTLTVNRSPGAFMFGYRGVPGGALGAEDRLVLATGKAYQAPDSSLTQAFMGNPQWAYLADDVAKRSLFLIQYAEDSLEERYRVTDADTAVLLFGNALLAAPLRFSFGLVDSTTHASVQARVEYVAGVTR